MIDEGLLYCELLIDIISKNDVVDFNIDRKINA